MLWLEEKYPEKTLDQKGHHESRKSLRSIALTHYLFGCYMVHFLNIISLNILVLNYY
jgi:hypothetical protein